MRNTVGFDFNPKNGQLYFTQNNRDWMSEDLPNDVLYRVTQPGKDNFGFPYCHQGTIADPEFGWGHNCKDYPPPIALLGPHSAPLGMRFYTGTMFPQKYRGSIIIARHGSWNRTSKFGAGLVLIQLDAKGNPKGPPEDFLTGFIQGQ